MAHRIVSTEGDRIDFLKFVGGVKLPMTFEWTPGRDRSLEQNRLQFLWAREASDQRGDVCAVGMGALGGLLELLRVAEEDDVPRSPGSGQGVSQ